MDIHSAMMHMFQLKSYLESAEQSDSKLYGKTRAKFESIYRDLVISTHLVESILGDQFLDSDSISSEFSGISDDETAELGDSSVGWSMNSFDTMDMDKDNHEPIDKDNLKYRKYVVSYYGTILRELSENQKLDSYPNCKRCAKLLWNWYNFRFFKVTNTKFRYKVSQIPIWVRNIILLYGKHVENGTVEKFCAYFDNWLESITYENSEFANYAVPYDVFRLNQRIEVDDITLTANMVFDTLYDSGLNKLSTDKLGEAAMTSSAMYNLCDKYNPKLMENFGYMDELEEG